MKSANSTMKSSAAMAQLTNALEMEFLDDGVGCSVLKLPINHTAVGVRCLDRSMKSWELGAALSDPLSMDVANPRLF